MIAEILKRGGVGVMPTDTIYGVVGSALSKKTVERIYRLRRRTRSKPMIILIGSVRDLARFGVRIGRETRKVLRKLWPGKVSVILPCISEKFFYLHRGTKTLAFRLPRNPDLIELLKAVGPLVAPSANPEGKLPAKTAKEAKRYFGNKADFYLDAGKLSSKPSSLVKLEKKGVVVLR